VKRLSRVGYDNTVGYLNGGIASWNDTLNSITSVSADEVETKAKDIHIVDVRKQGEYESEHLENVTHYALDFMNDDLSKLDKNKEYYVHCAGGYRSVIAISLLMQNGYTKLIDIAGGYGALKNTNIPKTNFVCPSTL